MSCPIYHNLTLFPFQSGFLPGDSTVNQTLLFHNICKALDNGHEFRMIFFSMIVKYWIKSGIKVSRLS